MYKRFVQALKNATSQKIDEEIAGWRSFAENVDMPTTSFSQIKWLEEEKKIMHQATTVGAVVKILSYFDTNEIAEIVDTAAREADNVHS